MKKTILTIILIVIGLILVTIFDKQQNNSNTPAQPESRITEPETKPNQYVNARYGFKLNLPTNWDYKRAIIKEVMLPEFINDNIGISLGYTLDKKLNDGTESFSLYHIYVFMINDWPKSVDKAYVWELGRNEKYVFGLLPANDLTATNQNAGQMICSESVSAQEQKTFCTAYSELKKMVDSRSPEAFNFSTQSPEY